MGQKTNPIGLRLGISRVWQSNWFVDKNYKEGLYQDFNIRKYITKRYDFSGISKIDIEKVADKITVNISAARPGVIIGKKGEGTILLKEQITKLFISGEQKFVLNVKETKFPDTDSKIVAYNIAKQIEKRIGYKKVMKKTMQNIIKNNVEGCKIMISGRLNGAEIARTEWIKEGKVPLHNLKAYIDYATHEANTTYGVIGIKVWIYKIFNRKNQKNN